MFQLVAELSEGSTPPLHDTPAMRIATLLRLALVLVALASRALALDAKWTPAEGTGDGPAPYSTKAREAMGIDPAQMAGGGQAAAPKPGGTAGLFLSMMGVIYFANNWKIAESLMNVGMGLAAPFLAQRAAAAEAAVAAENKARMARVREARASRLAADAKKAK